MGRFFSNTNCGKNDQALNADFAGNSKNILH